MRGAALVLLLLLLAPSAAAVSPDDARRVARGAIDEADKACEVSACETLRGEHSDSPLLAPCADSPPPTLVGFATWAAGRTADSAIQRAGNFTGGSLAGARLCGNQLDAARNATAYDAKPLAHGALEGTELVCLPHLPPCAVVAGNFTTIVPSFRLCQPTPAPPSQNLPAYTVWTLVHGGPLRVANVTGPSTPGANGVLLLASTSGPAGGTPVEGENVCHDHWTTAHRVVDALP